jgi:hypothetical protein
MNGGEALHWQNKAERKILLWRAFQRSAARQV